MANRSIQLANGSLCYIAFGNEKEKVFIFTIQFAPMYTKLLTISNSKPVRYLHWAILLLISVFIAHLIVTESQDKPVHVLVHQSNYKLAMAFSWPFTFLLMFWIRFCTKKLDIYVPWISKWVMRLIVQFLLGVVIVLLIDVLVVRTYFNRFDNDFEKSGYMEIEFPIVRWMVLLMNVYYIAWFFAKNYFHSKKINEEFKSFILLLQDKEEQQRFYKQTIEAHLGNRVIQVELNEIACFEREENIGYVYMLNGHKFNIDLKLYELNNLLDSSSFYQINRSVIISFAVIKGYEKVKNQQMKINLKDGFALEVSLLVSRDRCGGFKECFAAFKLF